ncbi:MAG: hypothetical protein K6F48_12470 [Paludibacteraceae bacterium]|nr:hypothetical protein [Paludibacteraceae bacterium]
MKNLISTIIFILTSTAIASACGQCVVKEHMNEFGFGYNNDSHNAHQHKGKVKMFHMSWGHENPEFCSYLFYDRDQDLILEDHRIGEVSFYKRYIKINGKIKLAEKIDRGGFSSEYIYSEDGKLLTSRVQSVAGIIEYFFLDNGKEYLSRKSASPLQNKKISYKYTYYDQNGNDTAIVFEDKNYNITHRTRKIYNQQGHLTEVYENDSLTEYYKFDSAGLPITDSCKMNRDISFEREEAGGKATYEYYKGALSSITRYDAKGNKIYLKNSSIERFTKYDEKHRITEEKTNHYGEDGSIYYIDVETRRYSDSSDDKAELLQESRMRYKKGTLVSIKSWEISRNQQEEILTEMEGDKNDPVTGKLRIDTTVTRTTYGSDGRVLLRKISVNSKVKYIDRYTYNGREQLLSIQSNGRHRTSEHVKDYIWDTETDKVTYQYDGKHRLISEVTTCGKRIVKQIAYRYDAANHLISEVTKTPDEYYEDGTEIPVTEVVTMLYDKIGNPTERTISYMKGSKNLYEEKIFLRYIYYDDEE